MRDPVPAYATRPAPAPRRLDLDDIPPLLDDPRPVPAAHVAEAAARSTPPAPRVAQRPVAPAGRGPARAATAPVPTAPDPSDPPRRASSGHPAVRPNSAEPDRVPARREPAPLAPSYPGRGQQRLGPRRGAPGPAVESPRRRTDWP